MRAGDFNGGDIMNNATVIFLFFLSGCVIILLGISYADNTKQKGIIDDLIKQEPNMEAEPKNETEQVHSGDALYAAIAKVESNGLLRRGKAGEIGTYQITEAYWLDSGVKGEFEMCWNNAYSRGVMWNYWYRYCWNALRDKHCEVLARVHRSGPGGEKEVQSEDYWLRVEKALKGKNK